MGRKERNELRELLNSLERYIAMNPVGREAVYCMGCRMWFDTGKGWQADRAPAPFNVPICPCCGAPLLKMPYDKFVEENKKQGKLDEVMTWEYPDGSYWD